MGDTAEDRERLDRLIRENSELLNAGIVDNYLKQPGQEQCKIAYIEEKMRLAREKQKLEQEKQRLEQERQKILMLKQENQRLEQENQRFSLSGTYGSTKDNFKQRPLQLNDLVDPSVSCNNRMIKTRDEQGKELEAEPLRIPKATIKYSHEDMWAKVDDVTIPTRYADGSNIQSLIAVQMARTASFKKIEYANEFEVQNLCRSMIEDALLALGLTTDHVKSRLEISIYAMRPAIVLVLRRQGRIFFVVEVKCPEVKPKHNVFRNSNVAGQIWSYLNAMKAMGDKRPMGAVMTYNKIALVTLDDFSNDETHKATVQRAKENLCRVSCPYIGTTNEAEPDCQDRLLSPVRSIDSKMARKQEQEDENMDDEDEEVAVAAEVYFSKTYEGRHVFPCLLQALHIAYQKTTDGICEILPRISNGYGLGRRLVFKLSRCGFAWVTTPRNTNGAPFNAIHYSDLPPPSEHYYVLGKLGEGNTAAAYLICNTSGRLAAMKYYFMKPSQYSTPHGRDIDEDNRREDLYELVKEEAEMWETLYAGRFSSRVTYLGGSPCLLMPYGHEIEESKRCDYIPAIKAEIERFAEKGYRYIYSDPRWHHVLLDAKAKIFLCDLASLEEFDDTTSTSDVVFDQLQVLLQVLATDKQTRAALDLLAGSSAEKNKILDNPIFVEVFGAEHLEKIRKTAWSTDLEQCSAKDKVLLCMTAFFSDKGTDQGSSSPESSIPSLGVDQDASQEEGSNLSVKRQETGR